MAVVTVPEGHPIPASSGAPNRTLEAQLSKLKKKTTKTHILKGPSLSSNELYNKSKIPLAYCQHCQHNKQWIIAPTPD
jgi:hypothetical protein